MDQAMLDVSLAQDICGEDPLDGGFSSRQCTPFHPRWFGFAASGPSLVSGLGRGCAALLLFCCLSAPGWAFPFINKDGQAVDIIAQLPPGQETVVFFHAPWSKTSSRYQVELSAWEKKQSKVAILGVQVKNLDSAVAKQYEVKELPMFLVFDKKGALTHQGASALQEVLEMMKTP